MLALGKRLAELGYHFSTVTPATQLRVCSRPGNEVARTLRDVFGWSRPFDVAILPPGLFELMRAAEACARLPGSALWQPQVRFSSLDGSLFAHSAFPTAAADSVFFGPDSVRFVRIVKQHALRAKRVVDVGCGSGVGGILLSKHGVGTLPVVLADINAQALRLAMLNAQLSGVEAELVQSDLLAGVEHEFDLVIANPPYLRDEAHRCYRDGGGSFGEALGARIVEQALNRLSRMPEGGTLLLYTGALIVDGADTFLNAIRPQLRRPGLRFVYEELDPDIFSDELAQPQYADAERIAAVFLKASVDGSAT